MESHLKKQEEGSVSSYFPLCDAGAGGGGENPNATLIIPHSQNCFAFLNDAE